MTDAVDARILVELPMQNGDGRRVIAATDDGALHVFTLRAESATSEPDQSFTPAGALGLARAVVAGNEVAMTAPHTLRVLAAALLVLRHAQDGSER